MNDIISDEISVLLRNIGEETSKFSEESFSEALSQASEVLQDSSKILGASQKNGDEMGDNFTCLLTTLTEAARHGLDSVQFECLLKDHNFTNKRAEKVVKLYKSLKPPLTAELSGVGFHLPHVVDANWRLDYCVKDSSSEKVNTLEYLVDLKTQSTGGEEGALQFACSLDEMQDLVGQLRDATKHLDKLASGVL